LEGALEVTLGCLYVPRLPKLRLEKAISLPGEFKLIYIKIVSVTICHGRNIRRLFCSFASHAMACCVYTVLTRCFILGKYYSTVWGGGVTVVLCVTLLG